MVATKHTKIRKFNQNKNYYERSLHRTMHYDRHEFLTIKKDKNYYFKYYNINFVIKFTFNYT